MSQINVSTMIPSVHVHVVFKKNVHTQYFIRELFHM